MPFLLAGRKFGEGFTIVLCQLYLLKCTNFKLEAINFELRCSDYVNFHISVLAFHKIQFSGGTVGVHDIVYSHIIYQCL